MAGNVHKVRVNVIRWLGVFAVLSVASLAATEGTSASNQLRIGSGSPFPSDEETVGPFAPKDCAVPREKPARIVLRCDSSAVVINGISWREWGTGRAKGSGRLHFERNRYPVKLEIHRVRQRLCGDERLPMFTRIKLDFQRREPDFGRSPSRLRCSLLDSGWTP